MKREIVQLTDDQRQRIVQAARAMAAHGGDIANDWAKRWRQATHSSSGSLPERDFLALVELFLLSLADGDFASYFSRVELRGGDLAHTQRQYEDVVLAFHLLEDTTTPYLIDLFPSSYAQVISALDHLFHNDIALLSRAYFREIEMEREKFYYLLTHDMKNSLTSVLGGTELLTRILSKGNCDNDCLQMVEDIRRSAGKIEGLIASALAYGQLKSGNMPFRPRHLDLEQLVFETLLDFHLQAREDGKSLFFQGVPLKDWQPADSTTANFELEADESLLYRAVTNYISNALKYADRLISVAVRLEHGRLYVEVVDDGPGLPEEYHSRVFEDYFQAPGSRPGIGLGLPSVRRIIALHGGDVGVNAPPRGGSVFWLSVPRKVMGKA